MEQNTAYRLQLEIETKEKELLALKERYRKEFGGDKRSYLQDNDTELSLFYRYMSLKFDEQKEIMVRIIKMVGDAFIIHNEEGVILDFDNRFVELLGYSRAELKTMNVAELDDPLSLTSKAWRDDKSQDYFKFTTTAIGKTEIKIPVKLQVQRFNVDGYPLYLVVVRNVSEHVKTEEDLRESEERFRTLVENSEDLIMRFDRNYRHLFVNSASYKLLGAEPEKFIGKTHEELGFSLEMCSFWDYEMSQVFTSKKSKLIEFTLGEGDDKQYYEWQLIPELNRHGEANTLIAVARNITQRKKFELALEEEIIHKDKFFSIIAHDLKSPFNVLIPIVSALNENIDSFDRQDIADMVALVNKAVVQEYNLLESLLEWARVQRGLIDKKDTNLDIRVLIETAIQLNNVNIGDKKIKVKVNASGDSQVVADKYMINAVIRNILSNAIKFSYEEGTITVDVKGEEDTVIFSFSDEGIGMSEDIKSKLFKIDGNCTRSGTKDETGTGLGLILSKEFVNKHNGSITVESERGKGSKFIVTIPRSSK